MSRRPANGMHSFFHHLAVSWWGRTAGYITHNMLRRSRRCRCEFSLFSVQLLVGCFTDVDDDALQLCSNKPPSSNVYFCFCFQRSLKI